MKNLNTELNSLENRQFLNQTLLYKNFDIKNNLVNVNGIYYRFVLMHNTVLTEGKIYKIVHANGNILTIREYIGES